MFRRRIRKFKFRSRVGGRRRGGFRRRILRRALRRRPLRPEIKYWISVIAPTTIAAGTSASIVLSPTTIATGTGESGRIGQDIMFRKVDIRLSVRDNAGNTGPTAPIVSTGLYRIIVWTPRVDYAASVTYMAALTSSIDHLDWHMVNVLKDRVYKIGHTYVSDGVASVDPGGTDSSRVFHRMTFKTPRRIRFLPAALASNILDPNKLIYMNIVSNNDSIVYTLSAKTTYTDA